MSPLSLRRSSRRKQPPYEDGNIVEISIGEEFFAARLVRKIDNIPLHWLVAFIDVEEEDEREVSELSFHRLIKGADDTISITETESVAEQQPPQIKKLKNEFVMTGKRGRPKGSTKSRRKSGVNGEGTSFGTANDHTMTGSVIDRGNAIFKKGAKNGRNGEHEQNGRDPNKTKSKRPKKSNRSKLFTDDKNGSNITDGNQEDGSVSDDEDGENKDRRMKTRSSKKTKTIQRGRKSATVMSASKGRGCWKRKPGRPKQHNSSKKKEQVEKVKFLTGTLYIYRGENPRVAFVRNF